MSLFKGKTETRARDMSPAEAKASFKAFTRDQVAARVSTARQYEAIGSPAALERAAEERRRADVAQAAWNTYDREH